MIQLMSRAGNFSCAEAPNGAPAAAAASAPLPALIRRSRRSIRELLLMLMLPLRGRRAPSMRRRQPDPQALVERMTIQEVCQRHVLRHKPGGVDQNPLVVALPALLCAGDQLVDFAVK